MDEFFNATQAINFDYNDSLNDEDEKHDQESNKIVGHLDIVTEINGCSGSYELQNGDNVIGRSSSCAVHINSQTLSKQHAVIEISNGSYLIYDLGSTNKTRKGKIVLKPDVRYSIESGDLLTFADVECKFTVKNTYENDSNDSASETGSESMFVAESTASDPDCGSKSILSKDRPTPPKQIQEKRSLLVEETPAPRRESREDILVPESQGQDSGRDKRRTSKKSSVEDSLEGDLQLSLSFNDSNITNNSKTLGRESTPNVTSVSFNDNCNSVLMQATQAYVPSSSDTEDDIDEALLNAETQLYNDPIEEKRSKLSRAKGGKQTSVSKGKINFSESSNDDATDDEVSNAKRVELLMADTQPYFEAADKKEDQKAKIVSAGDVNRLVTEGKSQAAVELLSSKEKMGDAIENTKAVPESDDETTSDDDERNRKSLLMAATQPYIDSDEIKSEAKSNNQQNRRSSKRNSRQPQKVKKQIIAKANAKPLAKKNVPESEGDTTDEDSDKHRMSLLMASTQPYKETEDSDNEATSATAVSVNVAKEADSPKETPKSKKLSLAKGRGKASTAKGKTKNVRDALDDDTDDTDNESTRISLLMAATQPYIEAEDSDNEVKKSRPNRLSSRGNNLRNKKSVAVAGSSKKAGATKGDASSTEEASDNEKSRMELLMAATQAYIEPETHTDKERSQDEEATDEEVAPVDLLAETQPCFELVSLKNDSAKKSDIEEPSDVQKHSTRGTRSSLAKGRKDLKDNSKESDDKQKAELTTATQSFVAVEKESLAELATTEAVTVRTENEAESATPKHDASPSRQTRSKKKETVSSPVNTSKECVSKEAALIEATLPYKPSLDDDNDDDTEKVDDSESLLPMCTSPSKAGRVADCEPTLAYSDEDVKEGRSASSKGRGRRKAAAKPTQVPNKAKKKRGTLLSVPSSSSIDSSQESLKEAEGIRLAVGRLLAGPLKSSQEDDKTEDPSTVAAAPPDEIANSPGFGSADTLILPDSSVQQDLEIAIAEIDKPKTSNVEVAPSNNLPEATTASAKRVTRGGRQSIKTAAEATPPQEDKPKRGRRTAASKKDVTSETPLRDRGDDANEDDSLATTRNRRVRTANKRFSEETFLTKTAEKKTVTTPEPAVVKSGRKGRKSTKEVNSEESGAVAATSTLIDAKVDDSAKTSRTRLKLSTAKKQERNSEDETEAKTIVPKIVIRRDAGEQENHSTYSVAEVNDPSKQTEVEETAADVTGVASRSGRKRNATKTQDKPNAQKDHPPSVVQKATDVTKTKVASRRKLSRKSIPTTDSNESSPEDVNQELAEGSGLPTSVGVTRTPRRGARLANAAQTVDATPELPVAKKTVRNSKRSLMNTPSSAKSSNKEHDRSPGFGLDTVAVMTATEKSPRRGRPAKSSKLEANNEGTTSLPPRGSGRASRKIPPENMDVQAAGSSIEKAAKEKKELFGDTESDSDVVLENVATENSESEVENTPAHVEEKDATGGRRRTNRGLALKDSRAPDSPTKRPLKSGSTIEVNKRLKIDTVNEIVESPLTTRPSRSRSSSTSSASAEAATPANKTPKSRRGGKKVNATNSTSEDAAMPPPAMPPTLTLSGRGNKTKRDPSSESGSGSPNRSPKKRTKTPETTPLKTPRKRSESKVAIMFTGLEDEKAAAIATRLGGSIVESVTECTHLITDKVRRTFKFLCIVARGQPIVTTDWLLRSGDAGSFIDPTPFLIKDPTSEKQYKFKLSETLEAAKERPLLAGVSIHVTTNVLPEPAQMKLIIQCAGGECVTRMPIGKDDKKKIVVISCAKDLKRCAKIAGIVPVVSAECILTGILQHKFETDKYPLL